MANMENLSSAMNIIRTKEISMVYGRRYEEGFIKLPKYLLEKGYRKVHIVQEQEQ